MAGEDLSTNAGAARPGGDAERKLAAVLFMGGVYAVLDAMSTLNSSPWTHETFGGDPAKASSAQRYVRMGLTRGVAFGGIASWIGNTPWPLIGVSVAGADLYRVYAKAHREATGLWPWQVAGRIW